MQALVGVVELFWRVFTSLKVAFAIIFGLAAGCFWGMFFDQTKTLEEHRSLWAEAQWKSAAFEFFELHDVFHSWWFGALTILLIIGLAAISIDRLPKIWFDIHQPERKMNRRHEQFLSFIARVKVAKSTSGHISSVVERIITRKGNLLHTEREGEVQYWFNERDRYSRTGVYLIHIALIVIMSSSFLTTFYGIDGMLMIPEGEEARYVRVRGPGGYVYNHDLGFSVSCQDFRLKTFIDSAPMDFESDLVILEPELGGLPAASKTIQVNHPLEYKGYTFYQASYQPISGEQKVMLDLCERPDDTIESIEKYRACKMSTESIYHLAIGDKVTLANGAGYVPLEVIEDYMGLGQALRVEEKNAAGVRTRFLVFRDYPKFDEQVRRGETIVGFRGLDKVYATGIQVGKSPFINVIFFGFVLLFVGLYMSYFMSQRRYWVRLEPGMVTLGGAARWHKEAFAKEFDEWSLWVEAIVNKSEKPDFGHAEVDLPEEEEDE